MGLHLLKQVPEPIANYPVPGDNVVEKPRYAEPTKGSEGRKGQVWVNKTQYFEGIPPEVWEFHVGGYQVCEKWLKDRKGRSLTFEDIEHYRKTVTALNETIRRMEKIDSVIPSWPME